MMRTVARRTTLVCGLLLMVACRQPNPEWAGVSETSETSATSSTSDADPSTEGATLDTGLELTGSPATDGDPVQRIFVSSSQFTGDQGGAEGADTACGDLATAAGLSGTWMAILSAEQTDTRDRVVIDAALVNMIGEPVAPDAASLWDGQLTSAILYDENGTSTPGAAWTGTIAGGMGSALNCGGFTKTNGQGSTGDTSQTGSQWLQDGATGCDEMARIYCIEQ